MFSKRRTVRIIFISMLWAAPSGKNGRKKSRKPVDGFLFFAFTAVNIALQITILQKAWKVYSICSQYSSVQVMEVFPPFLHLEGHGGS